MPEEKKEIYTIPPKEAVMVRKHKANIDKMKEFLNQPHRRFDGLSLLRAYNANEDAAVSYLRPKKNDDEVRIVSGTTEKRLESIYNELIAMNINHELHAFDKLDTEIKELGEAMDDTISRTNELELDEDVRGEALSEFLTQPAVFFEEIWEDKLASGINIGMPRKKVRTAIEVFLGDVTIPLHRLYDQPCLVTYERMSKPALKKYFGEDRNWKYVRGGMNLSDDVYGDITFRFGLLEKDECEIIKYYSVPDDEFRTYINGVPMMDNGDGMMPKRYNGQAYYPIAAGGAKRLSARFSYCKPPVMTMKFLQALGDETLRNIIRKFRQAVAPPRAVQSQSRMYSRDIFEAGKVSYGVDADALKKLVDHDGVTQGEMNVLQLVKDMQDEIASRGPTQMGQATAEKKSATEIMQMQQQAIQMLGTLVINWTRFLRDATYLRLYNIENNFLKPSGVKYDPISGQLRDVYRSITLKNKMMRNGRSGNSVVQFNDRDLLEEEIGAIEEYQEKVAKRGESIKISNINVKAVKEAGVKWFVVMTSKPKQTDDLHQMMFQDKLNQAAGVANLIQRPLNADRVIDEFEEVWRLKEWFQQTPQVAPTQQPEMAGGMSPDAQKGGASPKMPLANQQAQQKPTLNNLAR